MDTREQQSVVPGLPEETGSDKGFEVAEGTVPVLLSDKYLSIKRVIEGDSSIEARCKEIEEAVGGSVTAEKARDVIALSKCGGHVFHGVMRNNLVPAVREQGIKPLTPEGMRGGSSFWTSGVELFGNEGSEGYDSTFFHWGHSADRNDPGHLYMTIAITNDDALRDIDPSFSRSRDYFEVCSPVLRNKIHLLRVEVEKGDSQLQGREYGKIAEQNMFDLIEDALKNGYELGEETIRRIQLGNGEKEVA